jgi:hypothetical protein
MDKVDHGDSIKTSLELPHHAISQYTYKNSKKKMVFKSTLTMPLQI